jgi:hypothetical protein
MSDGLLRGREDRNTRRQRDLWATRVPSGLSAYIACTQRTIFEAKDVCMHRAVAAAVAPEGQQCGETVVAS